MISITMYTRENCHLCEQVKADLDSFRVEIPHELKLVNIDGNRDLTIAYGSSIPVVEIGPYQLKAPIDRQLLYVTLKAAADRVHQIEKIDQDIKLRNIQLDWVITRADRFSYWLSRHYMAVFNTFIVIYLGLPFLAPVLMKVGYDTPAEWIYRVYGGMCHQFAFRSWFLFGEQTAYPRATAHVAGLLTYGQVTGLSESDQLAARAFTGNPTLGYKVAICERDIAIYGGILLFGLVYTLSGRRLKSLPWMIWILLGILPIGIDGFMQLLSQPPFNTLPPLNQLPFWESTPFLRTLTGGLFGLTTAWLGYPSVEDAMADTREYMARKFAYISLKKAAPTGQKL
jgi:uncharacterized membrane protein